MSTTFGVRVLSQEKPVEVAFRSNTISFTNPLSELLPDETPVIPLDNTHQGIFTIGDIKKQIEKEAESQLV